MKQAVSLFLLISIVLLFCASIFIILLQSPAQKSGFYQIRASQEFQDMQSRSVTAEHKLLSAKKARHNLLLALKNDPYNEILWIRLMYLEKAFNTLENQHGPDSVHDVSRIAKLLRPGLKVGGDAQ